jgi:electron transfer flavoprotein alpha subunit
MELAPALAIETEVPLATDCTDIRIENDDIRVRRTIYNDKIEAEYSFVPSQTILVTARPGQFPILEAQGKGEIEELDYPFGEKTELKKFEGYHEPEAAEVDITKPDILVSAGRGIKDKENLEMAQHLAEVLGGALACSRPVVDYGWLPRERQVGISGKTVKPRIYLALGISGSFQHLVGMRNSEIIIAINRDSKAPIFKVADYGIVDDIRAVIPALLEKIKSK